VRPARCGALLDVGYFRVDSMSREDALMRKALKKVLFPELRNLGFSGNGWDFQRASGTLDLLSVQFGKYGGEFILEAARRARGDFHASWGEVFPETGITVAHTPPSDRARLHDPSSTEGLRGFSFSAFGDDPAEYEALAKHVAELLPQLDVWLNTGNASAHVRSLKAA
jgi:hypothetical protein